MCDKFGALDRIQGNKFSSPDRHPLAAPLLRTLKTPHWLRSIAFTPDGNTLVSQGGDGVRVWRAPSFAETDTGKETK